MTTFDDRKRREETRFKHDQELAFKARNRGNKLFGLWIAEQLGLSGEAAQTTRRTWSSRTSRLPGDDDIFTKVKADLEAKSIDDQRSPADQSIFRTTGRWRPSRSSPNEAGAAGTSPWTTAGRAAGSEEAREAGGRAGSEGAQPGRPCRRRSAAPKGRSRPATATGRRAAGAPTSEAAGRCA